MPAASYNKSGGNMKFKNMDYSSGNERGLRNEAYNSNVNTKEFNTKYGDYNKDYNASSSLSKPGAGGFKKFVPPKK